MLYLVLAFRYGTPDYVYPVGIYTTLEQAVESSKDHREFRGGKYDHQVYVIEPGKSYDAEGVKHYWVTGPQKEQP